MSKVVIFGNSHWASLAAFYLKHDSPHAVAGFTVDGRYLSGDSFEGLPVVAFEEIQRTFSPDDFEMFVPVSFKRMNHLRAEKYAHAKGKGYDLISYVSTKATIWPGFQCGDNCFILEGNNIQPYVEVGSNVVMWSGNHIGHHSKIKDHVMITSHVVISGSCVVEPYTFLGVNATIRDETVIARESLVGAGVTILEDTVEFNVYKAKTAVPAGIRSDELRAISHKSG
jgi:sugar O-acyltransferase (sialic acid O-acetyltransferase NeuD family)